MAQGSSIYGHVLSCFSLEDKGPEAMYRVYKKDDSLRGQRIAAGLKAHLDEMKEQGEE